MQTTPAPPSLLPWVFRELNCICCLALFKGRWIQLLMLGGTLVLRPGGALHPETSRQASHGDCQTVLTVHLLWYFLPLDQKGLPATHASVSSLGESFRAPVRSPGTLTLSLPIHNAQGNDCLLICFIQSPGCSLETKVTDLSTAKDDAGGLSIWLRGWVY